MGSLPSDEWAAAELSERALQLSAGQQALAAPSDVI
jgi:hypothetical protein